MAEMAMRGLDDPDQFGDQHGDAKLIEDKR
jgi:hypothetical protein